MEEIVKRWPWGVLIATAGAGYTIMHLTGVNEMEGQHWVMLLVILVAGYVLGRIWTTPARMIGLP